MPKVVEMDERISIFSQMDEDVGPVMRRSISFKRHGPTKPGNLRSSQGSSLHSFTEVSVGVVPLLTMQFGNLLHSSRRQLKT
jgi:hypothetical protein